MTDDNDPAPEPYHEEGEPAPEREGFDPASDMFPYVITIACDSALAPALEGDGDDPWKEPIARVVDLLSAAGVSVQNVELSLAVGDWQYRKGVLLEVARLSQQPPEDAPGTVG